MYIAPPPWTAWLPSSVVRSKMIPACPRSGVLKRPPPRAPLWFFEKTHPQTSTVKVSPPSMHTAPPLPPAPVSRCPPTIGHVELTELAPLPVAWLLSKTSFTSVRSLKREPTAPPLEPELPLKRL